MPVNVLLVLDELVLHLLFQVGPVGAQVGQAIHNVLHQMESVQVVLHPNVKCGGDGALLFVARTCRLRLVRAYVNR